MRVGTLKLTLEQSKLDLLCVQETKRKGSKYQKP